MSSLLETSQRPVDFNSFGRLHVIYCLSALLFAAAPAYAMRLDSFNAEDDLLRTVPRTIPGVDTTQIQTEFGTTIADRVITLATGSAVLTGTTLNMPGGSAATINYALSSTVDVTSAGANAFYVDFSLSDSTQVNLTLSVTDDGGNAFSYDALYHAGPDGAYRTSFSYTLAFLQQLNASEIRSLNLEITTFGGANTFSLDEFGTTVVPIPTGIWLFSSALGLILPLMRRAGNN